MSVADAMDRPYDLVLLETMPDHLRDSHRSAGNWGRWPVNGAVRIVVTRVTAHEVIAADEDGYDWIVRNATRHDVEGCAEPLPS